MILHFYKNILNVLTLECFYIIIIKKEKRGIFMSQKFQITLSDQIAELLLKLSKQKGYSKSTVIAMAIEKLEKEENQEKK